MKPPVTYYSKAQYDELLEQLHSIQEQLEAEYTQRLDEQQQYKKTLAALQTQYEKKIATLNSKLKNNAVQEKNSAPLIAQNKKTETQPGSKWKRAKPILLLKSLGGNQGELRKKLAQDAVVLSKSGLFDERWYLTKYPDVAASGINAIEHYLRYGAKEGRNPSAVFNSVWYTKQYPDIAAADINPLLHYALYGRQEGRACQPSKGKKPATQG